MKKKLMLGALALGISVMHPDAYCATESNVLYDEDTSIYLKLGYNVLFPTVQFKFKLTKNTVDPSPEDLNKPAYQLSEGKLDTNFLGGNISVGQYINDVYSYDLEASMQYDIGSKENTNSKILNGALFLNGNYSLSNSDIRPYVGVGIGGALNNMYGKNSDGVKYDGQNMYYLGLQAKLGASYAVSETFSPYIAYKFTYLMPMTKSVIEADSDSTVTRKPGKINVETDDFFLNHNVEVGFMIYNF